MQSNPKGLQGISVTPRAVTTQPRPSQKRRTPSQKCYTPSQNRDGATKKHQRPAKRRWSVCGLPFCSEESSLAKYSSSQAPSLKSDESEATSSGNGTSVTKPSRHDTVSDHSVNVVFSGASCATSSAVSGATEVSEMDDVTLENSSKTDDLQSADTYKSDQVFESLAINSIVSEFYKGSCKSYIPITRSQRNRLCVSLSHFKNAQKKQTFQQAWNKFRQEHSLPHSDPLSNSLKTIETALCTLKP